MRDSDSFVLEKLATYLALNLLPSVEDHVESHGALLDLLPADRADRLRHGVVLEVKVESLPRHELLITVGLDTEEVVQVLGVGHHVLLDALLCLVLGPAQVADVELRLVRLSQDLGQDLDVLWSVPALGKLGEVDVEAVH